jgi:hypothetical protein
LARAHIAAREIEIVALECATGVRAGASGFARCVGPACPARPVLAAVSWLTAAATALVTDATSAASAIESVRLTFGTNTSAREGSASWLPGQAG